MLLNARLTNRKLSFEDLKFMHLNKGFNQIRTD
jgi:hypothetical protein